MTMRHYIRNLRQVSDQLIDERKRQKRCDHLASESLEIQIQRWWVNLPPVMQQRRFQILEVAAQCKGLYRDRPALREIANALRALGWVETRDWTTLGRNRRLWIPKYVPRQTD